MAHSGVWQQGQGRGIGCIQRGRMGHQFRACQRHDPIGEAQQGLRGAGDCQ